MSGNIYNDSEITIKVKEDIRCRYAKYVLVGKIKSVIVSLVLLGLITPFAVHYEKMRNNLRAMATNSVKIHSLARKYEHLRINQIQLRFLHFNQHSITLLGIHMRHWAYKREKYTFIKANIKVINTILKVNSDN